MLTTNSTAENVAEASQQAVPSSDPNGDVILSVERVSKKFCRDFKQSLLYGIKDITEELFGLRGASNDKLRRKEFLALNDVSFELRRGEALGLIGKNGSGKSTLLRIIAGLIKPDSGEVRVNGRIAPLIALGAGFNPILTGRENVYANMSILGVSKKEIHERFDEVIEFAEIADAIDAPVQSYSSGMQARLGFASAIHTDPDILLIDEVLAVGDSKFRAKCYRKLDELRKKQASFILVSHNSGAIMSVCESSIYLKGGNVIKSGDSPSVIQHYEEDLFLVNPNASQSFVSTPKTNGGNSSGLDIVEAYFEDSESGQRIDPQTGQPTNFCLKVEASKYIDNAGISMLIKGMAEGGEIVLYLNSYNDGDALSFSPGQSVLNLHLPYMGLRAGSYIMDAFITQNRLIRLDSLERFVFSIKNIPNTSRCMFYQSHKWEIKMP